MVTDILLVTVIFLLIILILLVLKRGKVNPQDVESAVSTAWVKLGLDEKVGRISDYARDIRDNYRSFEQMLRVPTERGGLGEIALETILSDQLPPDMFGIRRKVLEGKTPDAYIKSTVGIICVDSKFPLDNYRKMVESEDVQEKEGFKKQFLKDVEGHLKKIASDYVCPEKGSAEFAFAYIPSEGVHWFLITEAFELLRNYVKQGVQTVSPLTLSHKVELIKAGVHARKLSEGAEKVKNEIVRLGHIFREIDEKWKVFYLSHLRNLGVKAQEIDIAYKKLRDEFNDIARFKTGES